ncbi:MAG: hypothetical protein ACK4ZM_02300, partial [bacterium]
FVNQVKLLKEIVVFGYGYERSDLLKQISNVFNVLEIKDEKIWLLSSYGTKVSLHDEGRGVWAEIETVSEKSVIPLKNIIEMDSFLDDGIPDKGIIQSKDGKYYSGCVVLIKNR